MAHISTTVLSLLFVSFSTAPLAAQAKLALGCPAQISSTAPHAGWQVKGNGTSADLHSTSIYNLDKNGMQEYELAPDDTQQRANHVKQTWNLEDYRTLPLYLRCNFGNGISAFREIPRSLKTCNLEFDLDKVHPISGRPKIICK